MNNNYYQKQLFILEVDKNDNPIKKIERWQAHKEGVLHRGFTTILKYKNSFILQIRKHPVFDGFFDLSFSSHPVFIMTDFKLLKKQSLKPLNVNG